MELSSKKVTVQKSAEELCDYLANVENFKALMPENTSKFELKDDNSFVFALKGMPDIALKLAEVQKPNKVVLSAVNKGDRKSTRLNSSHVRISYAVFCLKKKKKNKRTQN